MHSMLQMRPEKSDTETASGQRLVAHKNQSITALEGEIRQTTQVIP